MRSFFVQFVEVEKEITNWFVKLYRAFYLNFFDFCAEINNVKKEKMIFGKEVS